MKHETITVWKIQKCKFYTTVRTSLQNMLAEAVRLVTSMKSPTLWITNIPQSPESKHGGGMV